MENESWPGKSADRSTAEASAQADLFIDRFSQVHAEMGNVIEHEPQFGSLYLVLDRLGTAYDIAAKDTKMGRMPVQVQQEILSVIQNETADQQKRETAVAIILGRAAKLFVPQVNKFASEHADLINTAPKYAELSKQVAFIDSMNLAVAHSVETQYSGRLGEIVVPTDAEGQLDQDGKKLLEAGQVASVTALIEAALQDAITAARDAGVLDISEPKTKAEKDARLLNQFNSQIMILHERYGEEFWEQYEVARSLRSALDVCKKVLHDAGLVRRFTSYYDENDMVVGLIDRYQAKRFTSVLHNLSPREMAEKALEHLEFQGIRLYEGQKEQLINLLPRIAENAHLFERTDEWTHVLDFVRDHSDIISNQGMSLKTHVMRVAQNAQAGREADPSNRSIATVLQTQRKKIRDLSAALQRKMLKNRPAEQVVHMNLDRVLLAHVALFFQQYPQVVADQDSNTFTNFRIRNSLEAMMVKELARIHSTSQDSIKKQTYVHSERDLVQPASPRLSIDDMSTSFFLNQDEMFHIDLPKPTEVFPISPDMPALLTSVLEKGGYEFENEEYIDPENLLDFREYDVSVEETMFGTVLSDELNDVLAMLPEGYRNAIQDYYLREKSFQQIGQEQGVTGAAVDQRISKGIRSLRHPLRSKKLKDFLQG